MDMQRHQRDQCGRVRARTFLEVVARIQDSQFRVQMPPEASICKECDLRPLCTADGILTGPTG